MTEASENVEETRSVGNARRRWLRLGVFGAFLGVAAALVLPVAPREQSVRLHLGAGSSRVTRATARVSRNVNNGWDREVSWRFDQGAPPSIVWRFELPNGSADVEVELASNTTISSQRTKVELKGEETSLELADAMRGLP